MEPLLILMKENPCCGCCDGNEAYVDLVIRASAAATLTPFEKRELVKACGWGEYTQRRLADALRIEMPA